MNSYINDIPMIFSRTWIWSSCGEQNHPSELTASREFGEISNINETMPNGPNGWSNFPSEASSARCHIHAKLSVVGRKPSHENPLDSRKLFDEWILRMCPLQRHATGGDCKRNCWSVAVMFFQYAPFQYASTMYICLSTNDMHIVHVLPYVSVM